MALTTDQSRLQRLREELNDLSIPSLDSKIIGIKPIEPPLYKLGAYDNKTNTIPIVPALETLTLTPSSTRLYIGLVLYANDLVFIVDLSFREKGKLTVSKRPTLITSTTISTSAFKDSAIVPGCIAFELAAAFEKRYNALIQRCDALNRGREDAFKRAKKPPKQVDQKLKEKLSLQPCDLPKPATATAAVPKAKAKAGGATPQNVMAGKKRAHPDDDFATQLSETAAFMRKKVRFEAVLAEAKGAVAVFNAVGSPWMALREVMERLERSVKGLTELEDGVKGE
ncbi:hypothetical protein M8818_002592 [Zalaria obscura]|uniref:Uncharacterized protein n=1 Tax=Zalaria obscura TaxID=2024903 RepID=A0ACC3SGC5_9PEZI